MAASRRASALDPTLLSRIEDAGLNASAPPQQRWLDGWLVRFSPGKAKRTRCINAVAPGRLSTAAKLELARAVYREAGLPVLFRVTPFTQPASLERVLTSVGLRAFDDTRVMVRLDLPAHAPAPALPAGTALQRVGHESFAHAVGALRGSPIAQRQAHAQRLTLSPVIFEGYVLRRLEDSRALVCAQFALEAELVGLYDVYTAVDVRGEGLARGVCTHLLELARTRGAKAAYLQVDGDNDPARALYRRLGFCDAYSYHYRSE